jgi:hypothetical protein
MRRRISTGLPQHLRKAKAVRFLREHAELWDESPREIVQALKSAGIIARGSYYADCNVGAMLLEAKRPRRVLVKRPRCPTCGQAMPPGRV